MRTGDFWDFDWVIDFSYYQAILKRMQFNRLFIMTDDFDDPYIERFSPYRPIELRGLHPLTQLALMRKFSRVVMSNSTFCWWGTFLGMAEEVYFPVLPRHVGDRHYNYWNSLALSNWTPVRTRIARERYINWKKFGLL